jgi:hypothetical protein
MAKRTTLALDDATGNFLDDYCARKRCSHGEAVRRAMAILKFVEEKSKPGSGILIEDDGKVREVVFLV